LDCLTCQTRLIRNNSVLRRVTRLGECRSRENGPGFDIAARRQREPCTRERDYHAIDATVAQAIVERVS